MSPQVWFDGPTQILLRLEGDGAWIGLRSGDGFHRLHASTLRALDRLFVELRWRGVRRMALSGAGWMEGALPLLTESSAPQAPSEPPGGRGGRHFCAGADLHEVGALDAIRAEPFARLGQRVMAHLQWRGWRTLTFGSGVAMGGGCDLLLHGQERWAAESLRLAHPAAKHGILTGFGGTLRLVELLGEETADRLFIGLEHWDAATALQAGAIQRILRGDQAREAVLAWLSGPGRR